MEQALALKLQLLGPAHSETSNTLWHLGEVRWEQGRRSEAAELVRRSLEALEAQGVGAASGGLRRRGRLAEMLLELGEANEAERLLRAILAHVEASQVGAGWGDGCCVQASQVGARWGGGCCGAP